MADIKIFRYPGGKSKYLNKLDPYLSKIITNKFADVFVGGGSVLLHVADKYKDIELYANDKDEWVSAFWQVLSTDIYDLLELIKIKPTIELFYELANKPPQSTLEKAYYALFFNRTCFSGIFKRKDGKVTSSPIGGKLQNSKYKVDCRYNADKLSKNISLAHSLLKDRLNVSNLDFKEFLEGYQGAMYLDPPYVVKGNMLYSVYMNIDEHMSLASRLNQLSNWVLSYDDCDDIRDFYKNCEIINLQGRYSINGEKDNWTHKNELIIMPRV